MEICIKKKGKTKLNVEDKRKELGTFLHILPKLT